MKKILYILAITIMLVSCHAKKHVISSRQDTSIKKDSVAKIITDNEDIEIQWIFEDEEAHPIEDTTILKNWITQILPGKNKPPHKGWIKIHKKKKQSYKQEITEVKKKEANTEKEETKEKATKKRPNVKNQINIGLLVSIFAIILAFLVKYDSELKNNIKKIWCKLK